ncbi:MAG: AAA family ATPase [Gammaproteobacteria bacterium]|nr:AAA family ATPase [Gammaproteobacteria bacterium]
MIDRIAIRGFKSFLQVEVELGRMNLFVGVNGSGKSNFFDALRVLQGIGNGFTVGEILDGKPRSATNETWDGIRGGSNKACFEGAVSPSTFAITVRGEFRPQRRNVPWEYSITMSPSKGRVAQERLIVDRLTLYDSTPADKGEIDDPVLEVRYYRGNPGRQPHLKLERARPALPQLENDSKVTHQHAAYAAQIAEEIADMQRVDPAPTILRGYSQARQVVRMGERGENFAALVDTFCAEGKTKEAYLDWLKELRPAEVDDVATLKGAVGEPLFMLRERERDFPAPVLSDGTLRFAAIAAAFFQPDMPQVMTIEEIENGVHASRSRLLLELIRSQSAASGTQVMATTHSPSVLGWLDTSEYANTYFCHRDPNTGEAGITPLQKLPNFKDIVASQSVAELFADGWMEAAL